MKVRVLAFAGIRELLAESEIPLELTEGARIRDAWSMLARGCPALNDVAESSRIARNGRIASLDDALRDGDELALLPPVGGG